MAEGGATSNEMMKCADVKGADVEESRIIADEYKIWKYECSRMYEYLLTFPLEWPSLTVQWLPGYDEQNCGDDFKTHRILYGTHTGDFKNNLYVAKVRIPGEFAAFDGTRYDDTRGNYGGYFWPSAKVEVETTIIHETEVNRVRYMPQNPSIVATRSNFEVLIYDIKKANGGVEEIKPELRLCGQKKEGIGLSWNRNFEGHILAASEDTTVAMWDINSSAQVGRVMRAGRTFCGHKDAVESVDWNPFNPYVFASVGQDNQLIFWDTRKNRATGMCGSYQAHSLDIHCVQFSPKVHNKLLTASADHTIAIWDERNMKESIYVFRYHCDEVIEVQWSPHYSTIFASAGNDRRINIWDVSKVGADQTPEQKEEAPPELLFCHAGHTDIIPDFSWNSTEEWLICSTANDGVMQIWQIDSIYYYVDDHDGGAKTKQ